MTFPALVALVVTALLLTFYAHQINDIFDIEVDARSGKPNPSAALSPVNRGLRAALWAGAGTLPWLLVDPGAPSLIVLTTIYILPLVYSAPPLRLKDRAALGAVCDALLAHVAPAAFTSLLFMHVAPRVPPESVYFFVGVVAWSLFLGLRGILVHQLRVSSRDTLAQTGSFVVRYGIARTRWLIKRILFPAELLSLLYLLVVIRSLSLALAGFFTLYLIIYSLAKIFWRMTLDPAPVPPAQPPALYEFYEVWPAMAFAIYLAFRDPTFTILVLLQSMLFWPGLRFQVQGIVARVIPFIGMSGVILRHLRGFAKREHGS